MSLDWGAYRRGVDDVLNRVLFGSLLLSCGIIGWAVASWIM